MKMVIVELDIKLRVARPLPNELASNAKIGPMVLTDEEQRMFRKEFADAYDAAETGIEVADFSASARVAEV